jgi:tetratricopeptide (TPR) repeat protein
MDKYEEDRLNFKGAIFRSYAGDRKLIEGAEGTKTVDKFLKLNPHDVDAMNAKALNLVMLDKFEEALLCTSHALKLSPKHIGAYFQKGAVLFKLERYAQALESFEKCKQLYLKLLPAAQLRYMSNDLFSEINLRTGHCLFHLNRYNEALEVYEKFNEIGVNAFCNIETPYENRINCLKNLGRYVEAVRVCVKALKLFPQNPSLHLLNGECLLKQETYEEAAAAFGKVSDIAPDCPAEVHQLKSICFFGAGKHKEALESVNKCIELEPNNREFDKLRKDILEQLDQE